MFSEILLWIGVVVLTALVWLFLRDKPLFMETPKEGVDVSLMLALPKMSLSLERFLIIWISISCWTH